MPITLPILLAASEPARSAVLLRTIVNPDVHYFLDASVELRPGQARFLCDEHLGFLCPDMQRAYEVCRLDCGAWRREDVCDRCDEEARADYWDDEDWEDDPLG